MKDKLNMRKENVKRATCSSLYLETETPLDSVLTNVSANVRL